MSRTMKYILKLSSWTLLRQNFGE